MNEAKPKLPASYVEWELTQALIHLQNAIEKSKPSRAQLLLAAKQIVKGVR